MQPVLDWISVVVVALVVGYFMYVPSISIIYGYDCYDASFRVCLMIFAAVGVTGWISLLFYGDVHKDFWALAMSCFILMFIILLVRFFIYYCCFGRSHSLSIRGIHVFFMF